MFNKLHAEGLVGIFTNCFAVFQPPSADVIRRFRATVRPDAGQMRVFYGKADDPHRKWAADMTHGINTYPTGTVL